MSVYRIQIESQSPLETLSAGKVFGSRLFPGAVLGLVGDLGSGKTLFTKGLACGLGVEDSQRVTSPTFVLMQEYVGRLRIHHYDAYRLQGSGDLFALGFGEDVSSEESVVVVEWADRVWEAIPPSALTLTIEHLPTLCPEQLPEVPEKECKGLRAGSSLVTDSNRKDLPFQASGKEAGRRLLTFSGDSSLWQPILEMLKISTLS